MNIFTNIARPFLATILMVAALPLTTPADDFNFAPPVDICIYGGTSAGVMAAVEAHKLGRTVLLISPTEHLGGMTSSGLGFTDVGNPRIIGGLVRDCFHQFYLHYQLDSAWNWESHAKFNNKGQGGPALNEETQIAISFEPHVAEEVFQRYISHNKIPVVHARLDLKNAVLKDGSRLDGIRTEDGLIYRAGVFIDATYEGDLMAKAGVGYTVGREANSQYGETVNGIQVAKALKINYRRGSILI
jgi:hypothetical protein